MRIGLSTYTYTWAVGVSGCTEPERRMTPATLLQRAWDYRIGVVQLCDNIPLHKMDLSELVSISELAAEMGIEIEIGTRGVEPDHLRKYLEIAKIMNSSLLRTMISPLGNTIPSVNDVVKWINQILPQFVDAGVSIAIENYEMVKTCNLIDIVKQVDSEYVGVCLDTVNSFGALECPVQIIEELSPYVLNLHIKDFNIKRSNHQMGFIVEGCPAGGGKLDMDMLLESLQKVGKNPNAILELWTPFSESIENTIRIEKEWAEISIDFLRRKIR